MGRHGAESQFPERLRLEGLPNPLDRHDFRRRTNCFTWNICNWLAAYTQGDTWRNPACFALT